MSIQNISKIRSIIQDKGVYYIDTINLDEVVGRTIQLPNYPMDSTTLALVAVVYLGSDPTLPPDGSSPAFDPAGSAASGASGSDPSSNDIPQLPSYTVDEEFGLLLLSANPFHGSATFRYKSTLLSDNDIQNFLDIEGVETNGADIRMAAADALDAMASDLAIIQKKLKMLDFEIDGPSLARTLRDHADSLRETVSNPKMQESTFEVIEQVNDIYGYREKILKDYMREEV